MAGKHHGHSHDHHEHGHSHGDDNDSTSCSKQLRLTTMIVLIFCYFIVEIVVGNITHSLALVADAFHMLSDFIALCIALFSVWISKKETSINTFGWVRAEIVGALINSAFLVALCVTIMIEAIERFFHEHKIEKINILLYTSIIGLLINIGGLFIFGHGHSHSVASEKLEELDSVENDENIELDLVLVNSQTDSSKHTDDIEASKCLVNQNQSVDTSRRTKNKEAGCFNMFKAKQADLNIRAVFLHVLADALGSVVVIISALLYKYHETLKLKKEYLRYVDPTLSLVLVLLIICSTIPLLKEAAFILLQTVPKNIDLNKLKQDLKKINGVVDIPTLHVWKLSDKKIVASAHIKFTSVPEYFKASNRVKRIFHLNGIVATTIEPCFVNDDLGNGLAAINIDHNSTHDDMQNNAIC